MRIDLTPHEKEQIYAAAKQIGLRPAEFVKRTTLEHLSTAPPTSEETLDAKLRRWQEQDGIALMPDIPTATLFAQWAAEDALMTDEERDAEDRLWEEIEKGLSENAGLRLRNLE